MDPRLSWQSTNRDPKKKKKAQLNETLRHSDSGLLPWSRRRPWVWRVWRVRRAGRRRCGRPRRRSGWARRCGSPAWSVDLGSGRRPVPWRLPQEGWTSRAAPGWCGRGLQTGGEAGKKEDEWPRSSRLVTHSSSRGRQRQRAGWGREPVLPCGCKHRSPCRVFIDFMPFYLFESIWWVERVFVRGVGLRGIRMKSETGGSTIWWILFWKKKKKKTLPSLESPRELHSFSNTGYACIKKIYAALLKPKIKQ